jgi:hypothetical protein
MKISIGIARKGLRPARRPAAQRISNLKGLAMAEEAAARVK